MISFRAPCFVVEFGFLYIKGANRKTHARIGCARGNQPHNSIRKTAGWDGRTILPCSISSVFLFPPICHDRYTISYRHAQR